MQTNQQDDQPVTAITGNDLLEQSVAGVAERIAAGDAPPPVVLEEPPAPRWTPRRQRSPQTREPAVTPALAKKLEGPEKVIIHKRDADGKRTSIPREFTLSDLESSPNVEAFIRHYISPSYGPGEYEITLQKKDGSLEQRGMAVIAGEVNRIPVVDPMAAVATAVDGVMRLHQISRQEAHAMLAEQEKRDEKVQKMILEAKGNNGSGNLGPMEAMLFAKMMDRPVAAPAGDGAADVLKTVMMEGMRPIVAQVESIRQKVEQPVPQPMFPPPPPPPPQPDLGAMFNGFATAMATVMPKQQQLTAADVLRIVQEAQPKDTFTMRDFMSALPAIISSVKDVFGPKDHDNAQLRRLEARQDALIDKLLDRSSKGGLSEFAEQVRAVKTVAGELMPQMSIWDRLLDPNYIDAVGNSIVGIVERSKGLPSQTGDQPQTPEPVPSDYLNNDYPANFDTEAAKIEACTDTLSGAKAVLAALRFLFQSNTIWKARAYKLLMVARSGNKEQAMEFMTAFLNGLAQNSKVSRAKVDALIETFKQGIDTFIAWAQQK